MGGLYSAGVVDWGERAYESNVCFLGLRKWFDLLQHLHVGRRKLQIVALLEVATLFEVASHLIIYRPLVASVVVMNTGVGLQVIVVVRGELASLP